MLGDLRFELGLEVGEVVLRFPEHLVRRVHLGLLLRGVLLRRGDLALLVGLELVRRLELGLEASRKGGW